jgi:hypothetical protein
MYAKGRTGKVALPLISLLLVSLALAGGCSGPLCHRHLYIFRESPEKSPPEAVALVITDPNLAAALVPEAAPQVSKGLPWAPEQPSHETDAFRLSLTKVDGRVVYQGLCLDTLVTDVCEVRPGSRRLSFKVELYGPWGQRSLRQVLGMELKAATVYFFIIGGTGGREGSVRVSAEPLGAYTPEFRQRLLDWQRRHAAGRSLD